MKLEEIMAKVTLLEDIEAIKQLANKVAYSEDVGDWQRILNLFTDDCFFDSGIGKYEGKQGITKFFRDELPEGFSFTAHMVHNPIVEIKGDKAIGQWYSEVAATHASTNKALWILARYDAECVKLCGEWKFKRFVSNILYITPFDEGWAKNRMYLK